MPEFSAMDGNHMITNNNFSAHGFKTHATLSRDWIPASMLE
jgi:hypothetical protein